MSKDKDNSFDHGFLAAIVVICIMLVLSLGARACYNFAADDIAERVRLKMTPAIKFIVPLSEEDQKQLAPSTSWLQGQGNCL